MVKIYWKINGSLIHCRLFILSSLLIYEGINIMKKVKFVCLGNICRSPMAEMMFVDMVNKQGLSDEIKVTSSATSTYEIGNSPHPGAIAELKKQNVPIIEHYANQITDEDFAEYDYIIGMDYKNINDLKAMNPNPEFEDKIFLASEVNTNKYEIEDPWYDQKFDRTYRQLSELLPLWLEKIMSVQN